MSSDKLTSFNAASKPDQTSNSPQEVTVSGSATEEQKLPKIFRAFATLYSHSNRKHKSRQLICFDFEENSKYSIDMKVEKVQQGDGKETSWLVSEDRKYLNVWPFPDEVRKEVEKQYTGTQKVYLVGIPTTWKGNTMEPSTLRPWPLAFTTEREGEDPNSFVAWKDLKDVIKSRK